MKKRGWKALVVMTLVFTMIAGVFAVPEKAVKASDMYSTVTVTSKALKNAKASLKLYVNGTKLGKKGFTVTGKVDGKKESIIYLPSKAVVEAAGGQYVRKSKKVTITAGAAKLTFTVGKNAYTFTVNNMNGEEEKITFKYGKSVKKYSQIYIPADIIVRLAEFSNNDFDCTLKGKKFSMNILPKQNMVTGGWEDSETLMVPAEIATFFERQNRENPDDEQIEPVACLKKQMVAGMNYLLLCKSSKPSADQPEVYEFVVLYVDLKGEVHDGEFRLTDIETNINNLSGGWSQPDDVTFPEEYKAYFDQAMDGLVGVSYKPIAVLSSQVVRGMNVCILCEATVVYPGAEPLYAFVYVNVDAVSQKASILDIKTADINNVPGEDKPEGYVAVEGVDYMQLSGAAYAVLNQEGLAAIVNDDKSTWDNIAFITQDMVIDKEIGTMGSIGIQSGATVTIEKGGILAGSITIEEGATVIVKEGGLLTTCQGDPEGIYNMGTVIIEKGGEMLSRMGSTIVNAKTGKITVEGTLSVGCIKFEGQTGIWFKNEGSVDGKGIMYLNKIYVPDMTDADIDMGECQAAVLEMLGEKTQVDIRINEDYEG